MNNENFGMTQIGNDSTELKILNADYKLARQLVTAIIKNTEESNVEKEYIFSALTLMPTSFLYSYDYRIKMKNGLPKEKKNHLEFAVKLCKDIEFLIQERKNIDVQIIA